MQTLSLYLYLCVSFFLSLYLFLCPSVILYVCLSFSFSLSLCLSLLLFLSFSVSIFFSFSLTLSLFFSFFLFLSLSLLYFSLWFCLNISFHPIDSNFYLPPSEELFWKSSELLSPSRVMISASIFSFGVTISGKTDVPSIDNLYTGPFISAKAMMSSSLVRMVTLSPSSSVQSILLWRKVRLG